MYSEEGQLHSLLLEQMDFLRSSSKKQLSYLQLHLLGQVSWNSDVL